MFVFNVIITFGSKYDQDSFNMNFHYPYGTMMEHELLRLILNQLHKDYSKDKYLDVLKISTCFMIDLSDGIIEWLEEVVDDIIDMDFDVENNMIKITESEELKSKRAGYNDGKYYFNYHLNQSRERDLSGV